jgi:DNA-binding NtrC family response regulator
VTPQLLSQSRLPQSEAQPVQGRVHTEGRPFHRSHSLSALFVHRDADAINACVRELEKGQFTVTSDFVLNVAQCAEQLQSRSYDVIVVEYPSPGCNDRNGSQVLQALHQTRQDIPLIFLMAGLGGQSILKLGAEGVFEHVEQEHVAQLPMAVRRALNGKKLREELEEARRVPRDHSTRTLQ